MEQAELKAILELAAQYGVTKLKLPSLEVEFGSAPSPIMQQSAQLPPAELEEKDMLFWSSDTIPTKEAA